MHDLALLLGKGWLSAVRKPKVCVIRCFSHASKAPLVGTVMYCSSVSNLTGLNEFVKMSLYVKSVRRIFDAFMRTLKQFLKARYEIIACEDDFRKMKTSLLTTPTKCDAIPLHCNYSALRNEIRPR